MEVWMKNLQWNMGIWIGRYLFLFVMRSIVLFDANKTQNFTYKHRMNGKPQRKTKLLLEMHAPTHNNKIIVMHIGCSTLFQNVQCSFKELNVNVLHLYYHNMICLFSLHLFSSSSSFSVFCVLFVDVQFCD